MSHAKIRSEHENNTTEERPLLTANLDRLMAGGLSLVGFAVCWLFFDRSAGPYTYAGVYPNGAYVANPTIGQLSWTLFYLSFVCNFPHFLLSYQLLYWDFRDRIFKDRAFAWAAIAVPLLLLGVMGYSAFRAPGWITGFLRVMYLLVAWHYVKQIYGVFLFSSARNRVYYSPLEKGALWCTLIALGALNLVSGNSAELSFDFYGYTYVTWALPAWCLTTAWIAFGVALLVLVIALLVKYVREGAVPPASSAIALVAILAWYVPTLTHFTFFYMIPFFHSFQYIWFATAFRRNKVAAQSEHLSGPRRRLCHLMSFWGYLGASVVLGALAFHFIPTALDQHFTAADGSTQPQLWMALFTVFLNLHHYFIDSVIWRRGNAEVGRFLVGK